MDTIGKLENELFALRVGPLEERVRVKYIYDRVIFLGYLSINLNAG